MKKEDLLFDLREPNYSYLIGLIQSDGYLIKREGERGEKGKMTIELSMRDSSILRKVKKLIPVYSAIRTRVRDTNFKKEYKSISLFVYNKEFRRTVNHYGVPYGKKSNIIQPPKQKHSEVDYWRGIIDGDGSIGFTETKRPFVSLVTASNKLFKSYCKFIYKYIGIKHNPKRNKRDNIYNVILFNEDAKKILTVLYYKNCLSISRKYKLAIKIIKLKIAPLINKRWTEEETKYIMKNSNKDCLLKFKNKKVHCFYHVRAKQRKKLKLKK
jgi:hypothetical protein